MLLSLYFNICVSCTFKISPWEQLYASLSNIWEGSEVLFPGRTCEAVNQMLACLSTCLLIHKEDLWKNLNSEHVTWLPAFMLA